MPGAAHDKRIPYYPAFLDLQGRRVVVVGAGKVATEKVSGLVRCGASPLVVIAPLASESIRERAAMGDLSWLARCYRDGDLAEASLVIAATSNGAVNGAVAAEARKYRVWVLTVDDVPNCDFIAPATVQRGGITVAISTSGRSPAMARRTRERLDDLIPLYWGDLLEVAATARDRMSLEQLRVVSGAAWSAALDPEIETLVFQGSLEKATGLLLERLTLVAQA